MTITLITGANKGIGFETARQLIELGHTVYLGARDVDRGTAAATEIGAHFVQLDVTDDTSVTAALGVIEDADGRLDLLINNAGVLELELAGAPALRSFDTNAVGVLRVTEAALPLLNKSPNPTVMTISSSAGSFWAVSNPDRPEYGLRAPLYSASKAAANMLMVQYAKAYPSIKFVALEPGTTATDLTAGMGIGRPPAESARVVVQVATAGRNSLTGTLQDEYGELAW